MEAYGYGDKIFKADDLAIKKGFADNKTMLKNHLIKRGETSLLEKAFGKTKGKQLIAYINHSRWMVTCDVCGNSMAVNPGEAFFCMTCLNYKNNNQPRRVKFPKNLKEIEKELVKRNLPKNRNWLPNETLEDLRAETKAKRLLMNKAGTA